jgi:threonine/homoserine/homoserine lactone efflux protein
MPWPSAEAAISSKTAIFLVLYRSGSNIEEPSMSIEFLITSLIIVASPGTGAIYTLATGLSRGGRASVVAAFGCTLGIVPHLLAAMLGLAAILHTSALAFELFKFAGVAYLLYMAWQAWRENGVLKVEEVGALQSPLRVILHAVLINILNPKLSIFFLAFLPQFITAGEPAPMARMMEMSAIFMAMTFIVFAIYGLFAAAVRDQVVSRPGVMAWMRRTFAAAFVALGARLALAER